MQKKYLNAICNLLEENKFYTGDIDKSQEGEVTKFIYHYEPGLQFHYTEQPGSFHSFAVQYTKFEKGFPREVSGEISDFNTTLNTFVIWLGEVKKFVEENELEDPWGERDEVEANDSQKLLSVPFTTIDFEEDIPFTEAEKKLLKEDLGKAYEHIKDSMEIAPERLENIEKVLNELSIKIDGLSKSNWKTTAKDILMDLIIDTAKSKMNFKALFDIFGNLLNSGWQFLT